MPSIHSMLLVVGDAFRVVKLGPFFSFHFLGRGKEDGGSYNLL